MIDSVTMNVSYFSGGRYKAEKPIDAEELDVSWFAYIYFDYFLKLYFKTFFFPKNFAYCIEGVIRGENPK